MTAPNLDSKGLTPIPLLKRSIATPIKGTFQHATCFMDPSPNGIFTFASVAIEKTRDSEDEKLVEIAIISSDEIWVIFRPWRLFVYADRGTVGQFRRMGL
jgi:hypothetical protein